MSDVEAAPAEKPKKKRKKKRKPATPSVEEVRRSLAAEAWRTWIRRGLIAIAALYLVTLWFDGIGTPTARLLPRPWVYFAQVSALFTHAKARNLEYRAEGWSCSDRHWHEIDVRPYFPLDADNKENRFQRALQFYHRERTVMRALDEYIVERFNATHERIGGVRFVLLRTPFPKPGARVHDYKPEPLDHYSDDEKRVQYYSPKSKRAERCGYVLPPKPPKDDEADESPASTDHEKEPEL